jgi:hypothetical protein
MASSEEGAGGGGRCYRISFLELKRINCLGSRPEKQLALNSYLLRAKLNSVPLKRIDALLVRTERHFEPYYSQFK